jgi:hypothetical protein
MAFIDNDLPQALGTELYRPKPQYFVKNLVRPKVVWDWTKGPNDTVQLDRFSWWADNDTNGNYEDSLTKEARQRSHLQTIGVGSSRSLNKEKIILSLGEFTGPSDINNPNSPSTFQIAVQDIITAQRKLWEYGQQAFHDSIGKNLTAA